MYTVRKRNYNFVSMWLKKRNLCIYVCKFIFQRHGGKLFLPLNFIESFVLQTFYILCSQSMQICTLRNFFSTVFVFIKYSNDQIKLQFVLNILYVYKCHIWPVYFYTFYYRFFISVSISNLITFLVHFNHLFIRLRKHTCSLVRLLMLFSFRFLFPSYRDNHNL